MYSPLPKSLTIQSSPISGLGLFAVQPIEKATNLGTSHLKIDEHIIRTPLGGFINHSDTPNCVKVELLLSEGSFRKKWNLMTIKDIKEGDELTLTYTFYEMKIPEKKSWIEGYKEWKKKYSAKKDVEKILKYSKRKRTKFGKQVDQYWRQRDVQRLIDKGVINTKIQMKEVKKLLEEIK